MLESLDLSLAQPDLLNAIAFELSKNTRRHRIRVMFRCWKTRQPYNEAFYLAVLKKRHING
jgi:hypothetical protein